MPYQRELLFSINDIERLLVAELSLTMVESAYFRKIVKDLDQETLNDYEKWKIQEISTSLKYRLENINNYTRQITNWRHDLPPIYPSSVNDPGDFSYGYGRTITGNDRFKNWTYDDKLVGFPEGFDMAGAELLVAHRIEIEVDWMSGQGTPYEPLQRFAYVEGEEEFYQVRSE